jgi:uncharacterized protein (TIGR02246 family)
MAVAAVRRLEAMAIQRATDEANIRQRINRWVEALCTMDLEGVMSLYAPDIVSFDLVPPLRHVGAKAKEKNWANAFAIYQRPLGYEIRDLTLTLGDDVAFGHSLNRVSGTLKNGNRTDFSVRWTACFRKINGNWLIVHDQGLSACRPGERQSVAESRALRVWQDRVPGVVPELGRSSVANQYDGEYLSRSGTRTARRAPDLIHSRTSIG